MVRHTKGPWEYEYDEDNSAHVIRMGSAIESRGNYESHHIIEYGHGLYPEDGAQFDEAQANVQVVAAAPELLDLARTIVLICDSGNEEHARIALTDTSPLVGKARELLVRCGVGGSR